MKRRFRCKIKDGKIIDGSKQITSFLSTKRDGEIIIEVKTGSDVEDKKRSNPQNRYYWGVVIPMYLNSMLDTGDDSIVEYGRKEKFTTNDAMHEYLLSEFAGYELIDYSTGEMKKLPSKSSTMTTTEFMAYIDKICRECMERYDVKIPPPIELF